jgi:hypothetical protein
MLNSVKRITKLRFKGRLGHFQYNAHKMLYSDETDSFPKIDKKANFCLGKDIKFVNGLKK